MPGVTLGHFNHKDGLALGGILAKDVHPDWRLDGVRTHFDYQVFQRIHLSAGHCLDIAVVRDSTQQHAATRVGERGDFVRPGVAARTRGVVAGKDDLLEFPTAVLTQLPTATDFLVAVRHR